MTAGVSSEFPSRSGSRSLPSLERTAISHKRPCHCIALHEHVMLASVACSGALSTSITASSEVVGRASRQLPGAASLSPLEMMG